VREVGGGGMSLGLIIMLKEHKQRKAQKKEGMNKWYFKIGEKIRLELPFFIYKNVGC
jgi:hypothetical protein